MSVGMRFSRWLYMCVGRRIFSRRRGKLGNLAMAILSVFVVYYLFQTLTMPVRFLFINRNVNSQCILPDLDPFDPSIMKYVWHPDPIVCNPTPSLVFVDPEGVLRFNDSAKKYYGDGNFACIYSIARRYTPSDDYYVKFDPDVSFTPPAIVPADFFRVRCRNSASKVVYDYLHESVYSKAVLEQRHIGEEGGDKYSVFMVGVDSTSTLSAIRKLPRTYQYLTQQLDALVYKGYMKVGDNTFPNLIAILTGKRAWTDELPNIDYTRDNVDSFPLIWKNFSQNDYATFYAEDYPELHTFNSGARGFKIQPTDHYMRTYFLAMKKIDIVQTVLDSFLLPLEYKKLNMKKHSSLCYGNTPKHQNLLQYYRRFIEQYKNKRRFGFSWMTELCHEFINFLELADNDFFDLFKFLNDGGHLERAFLIFYSDHGSRLDDIRNTFVGRIEERMPLLSIVVPKEFRRKYPGVVKIMKENQDRLTSNFDFHETLKSIIEAKFDSSKLKFDSSKRGISLMKPIPETRSCADAMIPEHYCACYASTPIAADDGLVQTVAKFAVSELNRLLKDKEQCVELSLLKVDEAHKISLGLSHAGDELNRWTLYKFFSKPEAEKNKRFLVMFETVPGNAKFEATVDYTTGKGMQMLGDISRTNKYGNTSACVEEKPLRRYCYCKFMLEKH